jgi:hypothetical protein
MESTRDVEKGVREQGYTMVAARFSGLLKGEQSVSESRSGEHQELWERFQADVSERFAVSGAPPAELAISNAREATERAPYVVGITNASDGSLSVRIAFATSDSPNLQELSDEIPSGDATGFVLTRRRQCANLVGYVMLLTPEGQQAFRSPEEGAWTPKRVSQEFLGDTDPCFDSWQLGPA